MFKRQRLSTKEEDAHNVVLSRHALYCIMKMLSFKNRWRCRGVCRYWKRTIDESGVVDPLKVENIHIVICELTNVPNIGLCIVAQHILVAVYSEMLEKTELISDLMKKQKPPTTVKPVVYDERDFIFSVYRQDWMHFDLVTNVLILQVGTWDFSMCPYTYALCCKNMDIDEDFMLRPEWARWAMACALETIKTTTT